MLKPEQVPDEVMLAARDAYMRGDAHISANMRRAIAAAINAWPGVFGTELEDHTGVYRKIILPLPRENPDA